MSVYVDAFLEGFPVRAELSTESLWSSVPRDLWVRLVYPPPEWPTLSLVRLFLGIPPCQPFPAWFQVRDDVPSTRLGLQLMQDLNMTLDFGQGKVVFAEPFLDQTGPYAQPIQLRMYTNTQCPYCFSQLNSNMRHSQLPNACDSGNNWIHPEQVNRYNPAFDVKKSGVGWSGSYPGADRCSRNQPSCFRSGPRQWSPVKPNQYCCKNQWTSFSCDNRNANLFSATPQIQRFNYLGGYNFFSDRNFGNGYSGTPRRGNLSSSRATSTRGNEFGRFCKDMWKEENNTGQNIKQKLTENLQGRKLNSARNGQNTTAKNSTKVVADNPLKHSCRGEQFISGNQVASGHIKSEKTRSLSESSLNPKMIVLNPKANDSNRVEDKTCTSFEERKVDLLGIDKTVGEEKMYSTRFDKFANRYVEQSPRSSSRFSSSCSSPADPLSTLARCDYPEDFQEFVDLQAYGNVSHVLDLDEIASPLSQSASLGKEPEIEFLD